MHTKETGDEGRVIIVTGASRGIGAACAEEFAARDWRPVLFARSEEVVSRAASMGAVAVQGDITKVTDLERLVDTALGRYGRVDGVVVSTGDPAPDQDLLSIPDGQWHAWLDLLYLNVVRLARLLTPHFIATGGGSWVNVGSADLREPDLMAPFSSTIRNCLGGFTKMYARSYARHGIRMNILSPSFAWDAEPESSWAHVDFGEVGRAATLAEVAQVAAFLLSDQASFVSGVDLRVDGGAYTRGL